MIEADSSSNNCFARFEKGAALFELRKYKEAIECYDKALKIGPTTPQHGLDLSLWLYQST